MDTDFSDNLMRIAGSPLGEHLGWKSVEGKPDKALLQMPFAKHNVTIGNMVHGGAIAALADAAATAACWATDLVTEQSRGTTIALNINYIHAALGCDLYARAEVVQRGGSICVAEVDIETEDGTRVARATATYKLSHGKK
jgi:uncharacterized protein (TIGR00369 family)